MHHTSDYRSNFVHFNSSLVLTMQFNLFPAGARSDLLSQMVALWSHEFVLMNCRHYRMVWKLSEVFSVAIRYVKG